MFSKNKIRFIVWLVFLLIIFPSKAFTEEKGFSTTRIKTQSNDYVTLDSLYTRCIDLNEIRVLHIKLDKTLKIQELKVFNNLVFGKYLVRYGKLEEALDIVTKSKINYLKENNIILGEYYALMGIIALRSENPTFSIKNYSAALNSFKSTQDSTFIGRTYMDLGMAYNSLNQLDSGMYYLQKSKLFINQDDSKRAYIELNMAVNYAAAKNFEKAKRIFIINIPKLESVEDYYALTKTLGNIASIYLKQDSLELALSYYKNSLELARKYQLQIDELRALYELSILYRSTGDYRNAYHYLVESDSIRSKNNLQLISQLVAEKNMDNELELSVLREDYARDLLSKEKVFNRLILTSFGILLIFTLIVVRLYFIINKKNRILLKNQVDKARRSVTDKKVDTEVNRELILKLNQLIENSGILFESNITLDKLAKELQTNRTYFSEFINSYFGSSFSTWLNEIRIEHACKLFLDKQMDHYSIEGVASMCGFSTISTFNTNFKRITGVTPSYYRENRDAIK